MAGETENGGAYVSTGRLPPAARVERLVAEAYERFAAVAEGQVSQVYPALARVPRQLSGVCVAATDSRVHSAGDADAPFALMSVAKPFVFALVCEALGPDEARERIGVNATGLPFNSPEAVQRSAEGRANPMVNPGAIATTSLVSGATADEMWRTILEGLSRFAGRPLAVDDEVYASASESNHRNRELARLLHGRGALWCEPAVALDLYTRQSSLQVSARDLAVMGAMLADGGVNPVTGLRVVEAAVCHYVLAVMVTAGLYETSGDWLYEIGLPGKSGIGGGIVTVSPGNGGLGTFAPPLDAAGNSVRGRLTARFLSLRLGLDLLVSTAGAHAT